MEDKMKNFYFNCLLPEIIDSREERNMPYRESSDTIAARQQRDSQKTYNI